MLRYIFAAIAALSALAALAWSHEYTQGGIYIDHPWARPTVMERQPGAVFLVIKNNGKTADRLVSVAIADDFAEGAEIHVSAVENGIARMRPLPDGVDIGAGETVAFEPGGRHVMLFGLSQALADGAKFPVTLVFETAGEIEVIVNVEPGSAEDANPHAGHGS